MAAGQRGNDGPADLFGDGLHRLEVAGRGGRETGLDDVHPQAFELPGDVEFFSSGQSDASRLLAVSQGSVEYQYLVLSHDDGLLALAIVNGGRSAAGSWTRFRGSGQDPPLMANYVMHLTCVHPDCP